MFHSIITDMRVAVRLDTSVRGWLYALCLNGHINCRAVVTLRGWKFPEHRDDAVIHALYLRVIARSHRPDVTEVGMAYCNCNDTTPFFYQRQGWRVVKFLKGLIS